MKKIDGTERRYMGQGRTAEVRALIVAGAREFGPIEDNNATSILAEKLGVPADTVFRDAMKQARDAGEIVVIIDGRRTKRIAAGGVNGQGDGHEFGDFDPADMSTGGLIDPTVAPKKAAAKSKAAAPAKKATGNGRRKAATTPYAEALYTRKAEIQSMLDGLAYEMEALRDEEIMIDDLLERAK